MELSLGVYCTLKFLSAKLDLSVPARYPFLTAALYPTATNMDYSDNDVWERDFSHPGNIYTQNLSSITISNGGYLTTVNGAGLPTEHGVTTLACPKSGLITGFEVVPYTYGFLSVQVNPSKHIQYV